MEFDSQSQCSDDAVDFSFSEHGTNTSNEFVFTDDIQPDYVEAETIYLLLPKNVPISRAARLQWLLDHLNKTVTPSNSKTFDISQNIEVISAIPREQNVKCTRFLITYRTELKFVAHAYRFVYCLDMSPSHASVDTEQEEFLFDQILNIFQNSLKSLAAQFTVPNNLVAFQPAIYVTIMVNTPFFVSPAQQVILKGVKVTPQNLPEISNSVKAHFEMLEGEIAEVCKQALDEIDNQKASYVGTLGDFEMSTIGKSLKVPMVTADANFVNMLRYSMLAISLLPEITISHILVITDGIVAMPDSNVMETLLHQLHYDAISVSFMKVGSSYHPHSAAGLVSYFDLLDFFSRSTLGTCLEYYPKKSNDSTESINFYQRLFMFWSFHSRNSANDSHPKPCDNPNRWISTNDKYCSQRMPTLLSKRQTDDTTGASITLLLARRLREGFIVDSIFYMNNKLEIKLIHQWKSFIYIHYKLTSLWPPTKNLTHFEILISAPYEFLHDMTCVNKKETKSVYHQAIVQRFWSRLLQISSGDLKLAVQLSNFNNNKDWYSLPESVKNGIPLFNSPNIALIDPTKSVHASGKFVHIWQDICKIETNHWRKWFHTHRISLILTHDNPSSTTVNFSNSQVYQVVQCREAIEALYGMLSKWATFMLNYNHTYVKFIYNEQEAAPIGFCLVRVISKFPSAVLNLGFSTNIPGQIRLQTCDLLKVELASLSYIPKAKTISCCVLLQKPLEKILIRYEKVPGSYTTVVFPDGTQPPDNISCFSSSVSGSLFTTLSRYLFHKRWIWHTNYTTNRTLSSIATSRILNTLTKMRLKEGFHFAYSSSGIVTMVMEIHLEPQGSCVVQYVLFPPHLNCDEEYLSDSDEESEPVSELDVELQLVTEVWIEPQYGKVLPNNSKISYINGKTCYEIADAINKVDYSCISVLLTMEHMSRMCVNKAIHNLGSTEITGLKNFKRSISQRSCRVPINDNHSRHNVPENGSPWYPIITPRIEHIPFKFDTVDVLHLCQQTELLYSMLVEGRCNNVVTNSKDDNDLNSKANKLLLDNIFEHFSLLHEREIEITKSDSQKFTKEIMLRHEKKLNHVCPISKLSNGDNIQWKCYIKGVSVTHVILTFLPASIEDVKILTGIYSNITNEPSEVEERASSRSSNISDVPINNPNSLCLPVYVYNCPSKLLVNFFVNNDNDKRYAAEDIYEDNRFQFEEDSTKPKDSSFCFPQEISEPKNKHLQEHCKALTFTTSKCFTLSLFLALHMGIYIWDSDIQSAMDMCEEEYIEIDITEFMKNVCYHVKQSDTNLLPVQTLREAYPCRTTLNNFHMLIRNKFLKILCTSFYRVPSNGEYYYYKNLSSKSEEPPIDSDDETSICASDIEFRSEREMSIYSEGPHLLTKVLEAGVPDIAKMSDISPLFLHLVCTVKYNSGDITHTSVRVLPTCLGELIQKLETSIDHFDKSKLRISLDILCLTLPPNVQNILTDYPQHDIRTSSFCSDGFQRSVSSVSESSASSDFQVQLKFLTEIQRKSVDRLCDEIKWLLEDEICTTLLDVEEVTMDTLHYVIQHVSDGHQTSPSCKMHKIDLNFVYSNSNSHKKFIEEFSKLPLPNGYKLCQEKEYYFVAKNKTDNDFLYCNKQTFLNIQSTLKDDSDVLIDRGIFQEDNTSQHSDISSGSLSETEAGYDEDVSEDDEDWNWLVTLSNKRPLLPNFWLILKIEENHVDCYFHCRFLELSTIHVESYKNIEGEVRCSIFNLCKRVNQLLLLQYMYENQQCDPLLEPDDTLVHDTSASKVTNKFRQTDLDLSDDLDLTTFSQTEALLHFKPGYFSCPVVWQKVFVLHPRLKTGTGGKTRGISALRLILDKFLVQNRNNMFVYKDKEENVFYLRLYESSNITNSGMNMKPMDNDSTTFSRSPSIASLPIGHNNIPNLAVSEQSLPSISSSDIRPRVRSFGEKEIRTFDSKEKLNEDTLVLKVHGITPAGSELQQDLVQVLQNRLDDAVLEFLSIMLARNAMCPLTPEDVRFIQKPQQKPDYVFRLNIQNIVLNWRKTNSFILYLNHNLQHFLNVPKYTDNRPEYHFKDFCDEEDKNVLVSDNIFIYNQGQIPSAGNRGIACIVLALILNSEPVSNYDAEQELENIFKNKRYEDYISANIIENDGHHKSYLEFRVWKQGRINVDNLSKFLKLSVSQANWDIVMEYYLLKKPLCIKDYGDCPYGNKKKVDVDSLDINLEKEVEYDCELDINYNKMIRKGVTKSLPKKVDAHLYPNRKFNKRTVHASVLKASRVISYDLEKDISVDSCDSGTLSMIYSKFLPSWLEFGYSMNTPSVKKNVIRLANGHIPSIIVKELICMLEDKPKSFRAMSTSYLSSNNDRIYVPFIASNTIQKYIIISRGFQDFSIEDDVKNSQKFEPKVVNNILIPRRKIFWISVDNENILIYTYNWAKDSIDKLDQKCRNLANWLSVRSCYLNSVTSQKLGLFHNQPLTRKCFKLSTNNYYSLIGNLDAIFRFPRDYHHKKTPSTFNLPTILEAFRDNFYHSKYTYNDIAVIFTIEMKEMKSLEKKNREEMKKLHSMYQSRTGVTSVPQLNLLMQNCRILHYVHTPLLFLSRWRLKTASTRDHSLYYPSQAIQLADMDEEMEFWHTELCYSFFCDYKNYLHTLGFTPLQIDNSQSSAGVWTKDKSFYNSVFYIQRTILGGILIFTVSFEEPFFVVKLHAIECNRLQNITSRASVSGFTSSFLDECDKVKVLMHLHSFTYDYHLRSIYNYVSGNVGKLTEKYNVHQFLDDFLKYYNKAPNYARNLVHTDTLTINNLVTEGKQLYDYLRLNVQQYGFKVLEMDVGSSDFILVQVSTARQISYKDSQDRKHTDDFDMTLVVYNLCAPYKSTDNVLHLKYYLILTSKRDTYPMYESEQKLGKFRTVSSSLQLETNSSNLESSTDDADPRTSEDGSLNASVDDVPMSKVHSTMRIRQEPVTYLGYYSPHEQIMHQLILEKAKSTQNDIRDMVYKGMEHCRTTLLWNRLISPQESNQLTFEEFIELKKLAQLKPIYDLHPNLQPLLNQPLQWYQGLAKLLLVKYSDQHRIYSSTDGNVFYYVILHPRYYGAFMMLSLDLHTARGELHAVYRESHKQEDADPLGIGYEKTLRDGFVYCISFYLWSGMISN